MSGCNYIAIEGNIGSGKTSLAQQLAEDFSAKLILESFEDNPFLKNFYSHFEQSALPLESHFLAERYLQLTREVAFTGNEKQLVISDYFIGKSKIFSKNTLSNEEFDAFLKTYDPIEKDCPYPDLIVFLKMDIDRLLKNIQKRGRSYEQNISQEYLEKIQDQYLTYIHQQKEKNMLIIDSNSLDFVNSQEDYNTIKSMILEKCSFKRNLNSDQ